jgi:hypothetical protein
VGQVALAQQHIQQQMVLAALIQRFQLLPRLVVVVQVQMALLEKLAVQVAVQVVV